MTTSCLSSASMLPLALLLNAAAFGQCTNTAIPGKFYEYYIIAQTGACNGNTFTNLGSNPAINDFGQVGFMAQSAAYSGSALWVGDGHNHPATTPINPGETGSSEAYDDAVQLSTSLTNVELVSLDTISTTSPATTSIRAWNTAKQDSYHNVAQGGPHKQFGAVFPFPSINAKGDTAFVALDASSPQKYLVQAPAGGTLVKAGVKVSVGQPMIDDNGDVLLYQDTTVPAGGFQIVLYQNVLSTPTTVASCETCSGPNNYFISIDSAPGISHDGMVIAFQGNLNMTGAMALATTPGPGVFVVTQGPNGLYGGPIRVTGRQVETPNSGGNNDGICDPGETCQPGAELGFNAVGSAIYFNPTGYGAASRVAVMNLALGPPASQFPPPYVDNTFVISFVGTPSEASRANPVLKGATPLFFSASQGLWTIRVDLEHQLSPPNNALLHPRTAIPVAQLSDKINGKFIAALSAFDNLANAARDETGNLRTMRRGDHRVAFWVEFTDFSQAIIRANHLDSDQDGLLDHWETTGIDMDQDGVVDLNLPAMGANVNKRDLFLEFAWIADQPALFPYSFEPAPGVVNPAPGQVSTSLMVNMFKGAPALSGNEYGIRLDGSNPASIAAGITLHIDGGMGTDRNGGPFSINMGTGNLEGGGNIGLQGANAAGIPEFIYFGQPGSIPAIPGVNTRAYQDIKDNYFGTMDKDGRELVFHYVVFGDYSTAFKDAAGAYSWRVLGSANPTILVSASPLPIVPNYAGSIVKITGGAGAGQYGYVTTQLNATTLQLYSNWAIFPDDTSTFSIFYSNSGRSEEFFNPAPDFNSLPGNDSLISFGGWVYGPGVPWNGLLANPCAQWRTVAHEVGHTLGLRHGGTDQNGFKANQYLSLMSYSWQTQCKGVSPVQSYSGDTDPTFDDWAYLQHNFSDSEIHLGNTLGMAFGTFSEGDQTPPEQSLADYINQNGPPDTTPPSVAITSPKANANVGLTLPLAVTVTAADASGVQSVTASFDVNGNGVTDPNETVTAKVSGANTYKANFPALSGPTGTRAITAVAIDASFNSATANINVSVVNPNPVPSLTALSPSSATHGGATFTLTITGSNFVSGCTAKWNSSGLKTTFVNAGQVTAMVPASDIATVGTASITVVNPAPGGGASNALTFTIN